MRRLAIAATLLATAGGGVAAASALVPQEDGPAGPEALEPGDGAPTLGARMADPGGGPDWTVRTYVSKTGLTCPEAGRTEDGAFGTVDADGELVALPSAPSGSCADLDEGPAALAANHYAARPGQAERTVVFGVTDGAVRLDGPDGQVPVARGADDSFLSVVAANGLAGWTVTIDRDDDVRAFPLGTG